MQWISSYISFGADVNFIALGFMFFTIFIIFSHGSVKWSRQFCEPGEQGTPISFDYLYVHLCVQNLRVSTALDDFDFVLLLFVLCVARLFLVVPIILTLVIMICFVAMKEASANCKYVLCVRLDIDHSSVNKLFYYNDSFSTVHN